MQSAEHEKQKIQLEIKKLKKIKKDLTVEVHRLQAAINMAATQQLDDRQIFKKSQEIAEKQQKAEEKKEETQLTLQGLQQTRKQILDLREEQKNSFWKVSEEEKNLFENERDLFLNAVCETGSIAGALRLKKLKTSAKVITRLRKDYPEFNEDLNLAFTIFCDELHAEAIDRAMNGTDKPYFYKGEYVGTFRQRNDRLLETVLKASIPEKYDRAKMDKVPDGAGRVTYNIINYTNADETEEGFLKDIGVVQNVSPDGKIKRISAAPEETIIDV